MSHPNHLRETQLLSACLAMGLLAWLTPPLAQPAHYHQFADQRSWLGIPLAMDVLSNLPFAGFGLFGLLSLWRLPAGALDRVQRGLITLFFAGLVLTALFSAAYHWQPDDAGLTLDRVGMAVAFAGLLGLAVAGRISGRAGIGLASVLLVLGPVSICVWSLSGNVLPWAVVQFGGMALLLGLTFVTPNTDAISVRWGVVVLIYAAAKALELGDHAVFTFLGELVSGHSLKHVMAATAAWPVTSAVIRLGQNAAGSTCRQHDGSRSAEQHITSQEETALNDNSNTPAPHEHPNQFALLRQRRFAPFFWTQFSGAANDNLFKFAFTVMVTYQLSVDWLPPAMAGLVIGALFILPFLLFSATSGQLTDKFEKTMMIRFVKNLEIVIMVIAAWGFIMGNVPALLACTFLMGLHSTLFGPVKFAYLPQVLSERELTGGNGMVEMGTFVAILLGNVVGGLIVAMPEVGHQNVAIACVALAAAGRLMAARIPAVPATDPGLKINWNPVSETWRNLKLAHGNIVVFRSVLGISWMWFFGAVFLSQFPSFAKEVLHGNEQVASLLLVVFSVGIGTGSLMCEMLSRRHVEIGLVPLGAIGMSVFAMDLYFASRGLPPSGIMGLGAFLAQPAHWRVMVDLLLLSLFAGLYSVPMYALIQLRSQPTHRARIIAANNILNALFMIASSLIAGVLLKLEMSIPQIFFLVGLANAVVAFYIFLLVPEYLLRFVAWVFSHFVYRFKVTGDANIPTKGAALLACNHVSFIDPVLLMAASPRPIRFIMDHRIFKMPLLGWLFKLAKAIPVAPRSEDPAAYEAAIQRAVEVLKDGDLLAIFPEGAITKDGTLQEFKGGIMKILEQQPVPVIPMALTNLWGSYFSRIELVGGKPTAMAKPFRRGLFNRVGLNVGVPVAANEVSLDDLRERVASLTKFAPH